MAKADSRTRGAGKRPDYVELAAGIVSAYVGKNAVAAADIPVLINEVHAALTRVGRGSDGRGEARKPAVPVKRSVTAEYIVCLEDGKKFKSLRRHLRSQYDMTPEQYRERWGLPSDYPMVAPNYARQRSQLARELGLGTKAKRRRPA